jgi:hypothetical protein
MNAPHNGYGGNNNVGVLTAPGGLNWEIADLQNDALYVCVHGYLAMSQTDLNNTNDLRTLSVKFNNVTQPYDFPNSFLPSYALAPFWGYNSAKSNSQQGIYYQIDTVSPGRFFISIEFYVTRFTTNTDITHFITTYDTATAGSWTSYMFATGSADNTGLYESVGFQAGATVNDEYEAGQNNVVVPGGM